MLDGYDWPDHVRGHVAPLAVWEYAMSLMRQVDRYERALRDCAAAAGNPDAASGCRHTIHIAAQALGSKGEA